MKLSSDVILDMVNQKKVSAKLLDARRSKQLEYEETSFQKMWRSIKESLRISSKNSEYFTQFLPPNFKKRSWRDLREVPIDFTNPFNHR